MNPLVEPNKITLKRRFVRSAYAGLHDAQGDFRPNASLNRLAQRLARF